jgi:hypothetical protein
VSATTLQREQDSTLAGRVRLGAWLLVFFFIAESLIAKSHVPLMSLSTPVHIVSTAFLGAVVIVAGLGRPRVPLPMALCVLFCFFFGFGLISAVYSERFVVFNMVFAAVWVIHFVAVWWAVPGLFGDAGFTARTDFALIIFSLVVVLSIMFYAQSRQGRGEGFFDSATHLGRLSALAAICAFCELLVVSKRRRPWLLLLAPALVLLALSRTRASIGAALVGCGAVLISHSLSSERTYRTRAALVVSGIFMALVSAFYLVDLGLVSTEGSLEFFRLTGGFAGVFGARLRIWRSGLERLGEVGLLGGGFSEKFGGYAASKWGIEYPTYDWREIVDPHNMLVTTAIQIGLPAMIVLVLLMATIAVAVVRLPSRPRAMAMGVLAAGLVFGLFDGNWFITFSPTDRISMTILALMICCPREDVGSEDEALRPRTERGSGATPEGGDESG